MLVPSRLTEQMVAHGLSQSELARRVGVAQATIFKLTVGETYGSKYLHKIARELGTTPAYLTGETDDPGSDVPDAPELTHEERDLIDCFSELSAEDRRALIHIAHGLAGKSRNGPTVHAPRAGYRAPPGGRAA